ncbi:MAG: hypothetical protein JW976_05515, partial [Syntrophaceae bacterium]|nr:hypothetical protein [Syntrophaceae bacterium]
DYNTANEYKSLLHDKYKIITQKTRDIFLSWVEERAKIEDEKEFQEWFQKHRGRKAEKEDIEQYQNYLRAKELYCIKDKEQEKYEECIKKSGKTEKAVKPRPIGARMYSPAAPEYSPLSQDNIQQRTPEEVITDILDYDSSQGDIKEIDEEEGFSIDRKEALASIFSNDLKERLAEYLKVDVSIITRLSHKFIDKVFDAVIFVIQNKKIESPDWNTIIKLCKEVHDSRLSDNKYRWVMRSINGVLELALTGDRCKDVINEGHLQIIWNIFTSLLDYPLEIDEEEDGNDNYNDPYQKFINRVRGRAFESIIQFGLFCKNYQKELFDKVYSTELKNKLQNVLDNVKRPEIICGFGVYYVKLCWIDENWVRENLDRIFPEDDVQAWNAVWGSYIKWSRPSESAFKIAKDKYAHAIDVIKGQIVYQDKENYNKRLMEHVMLAYWQGWTGLEENDLIRNLLAKMDDQMRAKACHWITTGFEYLHKHEDDGWKKGVKDRLLAYWEWRYGIMNDNPEEHNAEACEFTGWAKDSPFDPNQTLDIIEKSQEIAGKISGRMSSVAKFVEGLSAITKNRELRVLEILRKAVKDPNVEQWSWEYEKVKESLVAMMDHIIKLDNEYPEIDQIRHCAIDIADSLGRLGNEYLRTHYDTLMEQVSGKS